MVFIKEKIGIVIRFIIKVLRAVLCAIGACFHRHGKNDGEDGAAPDMSEEENDSQ